MQPEKILKSDVLDILFENRNKLYGAYTLRREYDSRLIKAMLITFGTAALLILLSFSNKEIKKPLPPVISNVLTQPLSPLSKEIKRKEPGKTKPIEPKKAVAPAATVQDTKPLIVQDDQANKKIPTVAEIKDKNIGNVTTPGVPNTGLQNIPVTNGKGDGQPHTDGPAENSGPDIVTDNPDVYPQFPGGTEALQKFLKRYLNKPADIEEGKTANVKIRFIVNPDGSISAFDVIESGGDDFDKEVMRVLKKMPHWIPGKAHGHDVSVYYVIPVKFVNEKE